VKNGRKVSRRWKGSLITLRFIFKKEHWGPVVWAWGSLPDFAGIIARECLIKIALRLIVLLALKRNWELLNEHFVLDGAKSSNCFLKN